MLAHSLRFHRRNAINYIHKNGRSVRGDKISLKHIENNRDQSRIAVVVSKKVDKRAVVRNRIRRRIYEIVRTEWNTLLPGHDVVITVFDPSLATIPAGETRAAVIDLLKKAELIKDETAQE